MLETWKFFLDPKGIDTDISLLKAVKMEVFPMQTTMQSKQKGNNVKIK